MMHHHRHHHAFWDLCLCYVIATTLIQIRASTASGVDNTSYLNCSSTIQCGNLQNISYPFWGLNRASYCGLPDFELTCQDDMTALITISNQAYRVLRVDDTSQTMTVARTDYWNNICPTYLINTTQEITSPFSYTSDTLASNLTVYYGCQASPSQITSLIVDSQFNCTINGTNVIGNFLTKKVSDITSYTGANLTSIIKYFGGCDVSVVLAVNQSAIQEIESNQTNKTIASAINQGFGLQWTADAKCNGCLASGGQCGRQTSLGDFICYCQYTSYSSTCSGEGQIQVTLAIVLLAIGSAIGGILIGGTLIHKIKNVAFSLKVLLFKNEKDRDFEKLMRIHGSLVPRRYRYIDVKKITNSFSEKLGQGGYGVVYKGKIQDGCLVAVKILTESKSSPEEFINEVFIYSGRALDMSSSLEWKILHQIAIGIARGLEYLHRGCNTRILHFDIKPQNILLDRNFIPKISDFGLAKLCHGQESVVSTLGMRGTIGFIAPEVVFRNLGRVSHKSDVYSYGMLVLEMVGFRDSDMKVSNSSEMYFPEWIYRNLEPGQDLKLPMNVTEEEEELARKMIIVSLWCIQTSPSDRPPIVKVIEMLEGSFESLQIPPKPMLYPPTHPPSQHWEMTTSNSIGSLEERILENLEESSNTW